MTAGDLKVYTTINPHLQALAKAAIDGVLNLPDRPLRGAGQREPGQRLRRRDGAVGQLRAVAVQPRDAGSPPARIDVQGDRARGRARARHRPVHHLLPLAHARARAGWPATRPTSSRSTAAATSTSRSNLDAALVASDNTVFAQLAADLTEASVTKMAYALGVATKLSSFPAEALGGLTYGVTPLEMANVYATLADGGYRNKQITITKVVFPERARRLELGPPAARAGALERRRRGRDGDPPAQRGVRHRDALGDRLPERREDRHHQRTSSTPGSTATPRTARRSSGWATRSRDISMTDVHGEPQYGGAAAGADLAQLHGAGGHAAMRVVRLADRRPDDLPAVQRPLPAARPRATCRRAPARPAPPGRAARAPGPAARSPRAPRVPPPRRARPPAPAARARRRATACEPGSRAHAGHPPAPAKPSR